MKILINDYKANEGRYRNIFRTAGYEQNNLIFLNSYEHCYKFFIDYLETGLGELDLVITNHSPDTGANRLGAKELVFLKNSINTAYSRGNFRISSIPVMLYSNVDDRTDLQNLGFDAIVKANESENHPLLIETIENLIRKWRRTVISDLDTLGLNRQEPDVFKSNSAKQYYISQYAHHYERAYFNHTKILSKEFIAKPNKLPYDWLTTDTTQLSRAVEGYRDMYLYHKKYDRKNNERTVIHNYFRGNPSVIKRDAYADYLYETPMRYSGRKGWETCDFILKPDNPKFHPTTMFEVKLDTVKLFAGKKTKRARPSSELHEYLYQLAGYQRFTQSSSNNEEMTRKLGYDTSNYNYQLLVGRLEEKEEIREQLEEILGAHFPGIEVTTFEEYEDINHNYVNKFGRLSL